jgi:hypothetical protein
VTKARLRFLSVLPSHPSLLGQLNTTSCSDSSILQMSAEPLLACGVSLMNRPFLTLSEGWKSMLA